MEKVQLKFNGKKAFPLIESDIQKVYIGPIIQSGNYVNQQCVIVLPYMGVTFNVECKDGYAVKFLYGIRDNSTTGESSPWIQGKASFTFPKDYEGKHNAHCYKCVFAKVTNGNIGTSSVSVFTIQNLLDNDSILITYEGDKTNLFDRNAECEKCVRAASYKTYVVAGDKSSNYDNNIPVIAHASDVHGDYYRLKNCLEYCDYLGIRYVVLSGDFVVWNANDGLEWVYDLCKDYKVVPLICVGNHEMFGGTNAKTYSTHFNNFIAKYNYVVNSNETYPLYYYKDDNTLKLRFIILNQYNNSSNIYYSQEQLNWFIDKLLNTPANYGVIVSYHRIESEVVADEGKEFWRTRIWDNVLSTDPSSKPIQKIISAFIAGGTDTISYDGNTYSVDFSSKNSGVQFISYISGHFHADIIGTIKGAETRQVSLGICCDNASYDKNSDRSKNGGKGAAQDTFNIYGIDRASNLIKIAKVGNTMSSNMLENRYMQMVYV